MAEEDEKLFRVVIGREVETSVHRNERRRRQRKLEEGQSEDVERHFFAERIGIRFNLVFTGNRDKWIVAQLSRFGRAKLSGLVDIGDVLHELRVANTAIRISVDESTTAADLERCFLGDTMPTINSSETTISSEIELVLSRPIVVDKDMFPVLPSPEMIGPFETMNLEVTRLPKAGQGDDELNTSIENLEDTSLINSLICYEVRRSFRCGR